MKKGEKAKIRIKKDYGYGNAYEVEKLRWPKDYEEAGSKNRKRLETE